MNKQEDLDFLHPSVGICVRLPLDLVADPARRDKWVSSRARPDLLYLRPEHQLGPAERDLFRWMAIMSQESHKRLGTFVKGAVSRELPVRKFSTLVTDKKYEPPAKRAKTSKHSHAEEAAAAPGAKVKTPRRSKKLAKVEAKAQAGAA
jgi:hypothetical protein